MHEQNETIRQLDATVLVITQSKPETVRNTRLPYEVLCDPERMAFRYFGLDRGRFGMFFRMRVLAYYLRMMMRGWWPHRVEKGEDVLQLGGDVILSADRKLIFVHRSIDPADRPSVTELIHQLKSAIAKSQ